MFRATRSRWTTSLSIQIFQAGATNLQLCQGKRLLENMDLTFLLIKNKQRQQKMSKNVYSSKTITTYKLKKIIKKLNAHKIIIKLKDSFLWSSFHIPVLTLKLLATNAKDFITISVVIQIKYTSHPYGNHWLKLIDDIHHRFSLSPSREGCQYLAQCCEVFHFLRILDSLKFTLKLKDRYLYLLTSNVKKKSINL